MSTALSDNALTPERCVVRDAASRRRTADPFFGVNVQPDFTRGGSGLEPGRTATRS